MPRWKRRGIFFFDPASIREPSRICRRKGISFPLRLFRADNAQRKDFSSWPPFFVHNVVVNRAKDSITVVRAAQT
jgi:hypothetical protein